MGCKPRSNNLGKSTNESKDYRTRSTSSYNPYLIHFCDPSTKLLTPSMNVSVTHPTDRQMLLDGKDGINVCACVGVKKTKLTKNM